MHSYRTSSKFLFRDLSNTAITELPTKGLSTLKNLTIHHTPSLRRFPPVLELPSIQSASLTYPHHCCAFAHPEKQNEQLWLDFEKEIDSNCDSLTTAGIPAAKNGGSSGFLITTAGLSTTVAPGIQV